MTDLKTAAQMIKNGERSEARRIVSALLKREPDNDEAWYYAAMLSDAPEQRARFLQKALELNPFHDRADAALKKITSSVGGAVRVTPNDRSAAPAAKSGASGVMIAAIVVAVLGLVGMVAYGALSLTGRGAPAPVAQVAPTQAVLSAADFAATGTAVARMPSEAPASVQADAAVTGAPPAATPTPAPYQITATAYLHAAQTSDASLRLTATAAAGG